MQTIGKFRKKERHLSHPLYEATDINLIPKPERNKTTKENCTQIHLGTQLRITKTLASHNEE